MKLDNNEDIFTTNKNRIYYDVNKVDDSYVATYPDKNYIYFFSYKNLTQKYNLESGQTELYLQKSNDEYELLYESSIVDGMENASFYSKDNVYVLNNYNQKTSDINKLSCIPKTDFIKFANRFSGNTSKNIINYLNDTISAYSLAMHSTPLIMYNSTFKENYYNKPLFKEYRRLFVKYKSATILIPVSAILGEVISNVNKYITTGKLNIEKLKKNLSELQNFKEVCKNSISLLSSFIDNPHSTDLRNFCDALEKNVHNVDNLINLYLEDELSLQKEGEVL